MAKKLSFDKLPSAVEKILEILTAEGSDHTALPELVQRVVVMEKRLDKIEQLLSPNRLVMDKLTVLRVLKIRPKMLNELESSGVLLSHTEGRRTFYYEDDVVRCFMNQSAWKAAIEDASKAKSVEPASDSPVSDDSESAPVNDRLIDIEAAAGMIGRTKLTVYKLTSKDKIPFIRQGRKLLFEVEALEQWMADKSTRKRTTQADRAESGPLEETEGLVDINGASEILGRTPAAVRQHLSSIPHEKVGGKLYFDPKELEAWSETHRPRPRKPKPDSDETETA